MSPEEISLLERLALGLFMKISDLVSDAHAGKVSAEDAAKALKAIDAHHDELAADRAAADKALDDKFPG